MENILQHHKLNVNIQGNLIAEITLQIHNLSKSQASALTFLPERFYSIS